MVSIIKSHFQTKQLLFVYLFVCEQSETFISLDPLFGLNTKFLDIFRQI